MDFFFKKKNKGSYLGLRKKNVSFGSVSFFLGFNSEKVRYRVFFQLAFFIFSDLSSQPQSIKFTIWESFGRHQVIFLCGTENEDAETEEGQLEKTLIGSLWIKLSTFFEAEHDKMLTMTTQEEVGEKMNSSSKTMVQAVTLLTALRMFANGKI